MKKYALLILFLAIGFQYTIAQDAAAFYDVDRITEINIKTPHKDWAGTLDSLRLQGSGLMFATVTIDGEMYKNAGVRFRGSRSFKIGKKRNPLHIKLNYINKNQNHQGYKTIKLSNSLRDPSMLREVLGYEIARDYMPAPKANFAKVNINGEFYGLLVNVEDISNEFLTSQFGSDDGAFFKCSPDISKKPTPGCKKGTFASLEYEDGVQCYIENYEMKSEDGWDDIIELTSILANNPKDIEKVLNVDRTLWMLAFNNVLVNLSSYSGKNSQNYYLYKDSKGQFNPIIWDLNLAFGSFKNVGGGSDLVLKELQSLDPLLHADNPYKPLVSQLMKSDEYKKIYLSHMRTILYDHFVEGQYKSRAEELQRMISNDLFRDKNRGYEHNEFLKGLTTTIGKRSRIPGIVELMEKRARFLKKHPKLAVFPPALSDINVVGREQFSNQQVDKFHIVATVAQLPKRVKVYYRFNKNQEYQSMFMEDNGKFHDGAAGDKTFGAVVDPKGMYEALEYYIVAENVESMSFTPSNYMYEPFKSTLQELNK